MSPPATLYSVGSQSVACIKSMLTRPFWASKGLCTNPAPRTPPVKTFDDFQSTYTLTTKNAYHFIGIHVLQTSKSLTTKGDLHLLSPYNITHWGKMFFTLSWMWDKEKNWEFPWGIEPQTFEFRAQMLFHWATETLWWARPKFTKFMYNTRPAYF